MNRRRNLILCALALVAATLPFFARSAAAAPIFTSGRPQSPAVAQSSYDGSFLIVWAEDRGAGTGLDLYGARVNAAGVVIGTEVPILVAAGNQSDPTLAYSPHNNAYLVLYTTDAASTSPLPTPGGSTPGVPTPGGTPGMPTPPLPPIPAPGDGRADAPDQPPPPPPLPTPLPTSGGVPTSLPLPTPLGTLTPPVPGPTGTLPPGVPTATPDPNGPPAPPTASGSRDIHGVWVAPSGFRITTTFAVVASPADDTYPDLGFVFSPGTERYALVWREVTGLSAAISVMRLEGMGYFFVPYPKSTIISGGDLGRPSVAGEQTEGSFFVAWAQTPRDNPAREVYGRKLNLNAIPMGPVRELASGPADQVYPSIASLGSAGGYILTWEERMPGQPPDIRVRRLNRNGMAQGAMFDVAGGAAFSFAPDIASSEASSSLLVWVDRNAASDQSILGVEVNRDGRRVSVERTIVTGGAGPGAVTPIVPGPGMPTPPGPPILPTPLPTP